MDRPAVLCWLCAMRPVVHNDSVARQLLHNYASCCPRCAEDMTYDAAYRFMRDVICGCNGAERFLLLHHTLHDGRPQVSWNTIVRMFRPRSSALEKRRVPTLNEFISRQKVLHLQIQFPRRGKEEVENWRQRTRHPSVPIYYLYNCSRFSVTKVLRPDPLLLAVCPLLMSN